MRRQFEFHLYPQANLGKSFTLRFNVTISKIRLILSTLGIRMKIKHIIYKTTLHNAFLKLGIFMTARKFSQRQWFLTLAAH